MSTKLDENQKAAMAKDENERTQRGENGDVKLTKETHMP
jgi:hypothetical protein